MLFIIFVLIIEIYTQAEESQLISVLVLKGRRLTIIKTISVADFFNFTLVIFWAGHNSMLFFTRLKIKMKIKKLYI
jgi:hypothetical protein